MRIPIKRLLPLVLVVVTVVSLLSTATSTRAQNPVEINFYYPTAVGGPIDKIMAGFAADFEKANPDIKVTPVFAGGYADIYKAVETQINGGSTKVDVAIFLSTDMYSLIDNDYIVSLDSFIKASPDGDAYIKDFYPAFLTNSQDSGSTWGIPFQRSTPVLYYNKDLFKAAGLDPSAAPKTWADMLADAHKLTKSEGSQWGIEIPSDGFPYWLFQGFAIGNGQNLVGDDPDKVFFNTPTTVEGLQYFVDLANKEKVMPTGVIAWNDTPTDFEAGKAAMIYHTTGSLTTILSKSKFDVGVGFLPQGKKGYGAPTGGGNLYIIKNAPADHQQAAWKWIQYLSSPDVEAQWTAATGYIAPRQSAWQTKTLTDLVAVKPQYGVARDQLQYAAKELATHQGADIQHIMGQAIQAALTGQKTPQQALDDAQKAAEAILANYAATPAK